MSVFTLIMIIVSVGVVRGGSSWISSDGQTIPYIPNTGNDGDEFHYRPFHQNSRHPSPYPPTIALPLDEEEFYLLSYNKTIVHHPGFLAALTSSRLGRSHLNAYLWVLGGLDQEDENWDKMNTLLTSLTPTKSPGEPEITETVYSTPSPDLGLFNPFLHLINLPPFKNIQSIYHNSELLVTLQNFLSNHSELSTKSSNLFLIPLQINLTTGHLLHGSFIQMFSKIPLLHSRLFKPNNIIYLVDTVGHLTDNSDSEIPNTQRVLNYCRQLLQGFTQLLVPLDQIFILPAKNPNNKVDKNSPLFQWNNLIQSGLVQKFLDLTKKSGDSLGREILNQFFKNKIPPLPLNLTHHPIQNFQHTQYTTYLKLLTPPTNQSPSSKDSIGHPGNCTLAGDLNDVTKNVSEIDLLLDDTFDYLNPKIKRRHKIDLILLKNIFHQNNLTSLSQLPSTRQDLIILFRQLPLTDFVINICESALGLIVPPFPLISSIGLGYDALRDIQLNKNPFDLSSQPKIVSRVGWRVPSTFKLENVNEVKSIFQIFQSDQKYKEEILKKLNLNFVDPLRYEGKIPPSAGINILDSFSSGFSGVQLFPKFEFSISLQTTPLSSEFLDAVSNLPPYKTYDENAVSNWTSFFQEWGTHITYSGSGGGWLSIQTNQPLFPPQNSVIHPGSAIVVNQSQIITSAFVQLFQLFGGSIQTMKDFSKRPYTLKMEGGDPNLENFNSNKLDLQLASNLLHSWENSLSFSPTIFPVKMNLMVSDSSPLANIAEIIERISPDTALNARLAMRDYFRGNLVYVSTTSTTTTTTVPLPSKEQILLDFMTQNFTIEFQRLNQRMKNESQGHMEQMAGMRQRLEEQANIYRETIQRLSEEGDFLRAKMTNETQRHALELRTVQEIFLNESRHHRQILEDTEKERIRLSRQLQMETESYRTEMSNLQNSHMNRSTVQELTIRELTRETLVLSQRIDRENVTHVLELSRLKSVYDQETLNHERTVQQLRTEIERLSTLAENWQKKLQSEVAANRNFSAGIIITMNKEREDYNKEMGMMSQKLVDIVGNFSAALEAKDQANYEGRNEEREALLEERKRLDEMVKEVVDEQTKERQRRDQQIQTLFEKSLAETVNSQKQTQTLITSFTGILDKKQNQNDALVKNLIDKSG